ncbi:hypothetical protein AMTR_s00049p00053090 [Amborella trichopoda]|uniref:Uncharacterized protein n=1 Tax=Amborella trichopoda TaxID=13333 RepID=W1PU89_AMBTC|nr:hypothetical protein AMTR_s00049p00053090 [Amborella trichopoda]
MDSGEEDEPKAKPRKKLIKKSNKESSPENDFLADEVQENEDFSAGKLKGKEGSSKKRKPNEERAHKEKQIRAKSRERRLGKEFKRLRIWSWVYFYIFWS